jgi:hypothetical protein
VTGPLDETAAIATDLVLTTLRHYLRHIDEGDTDAAGRWLGHLRVDLADLDAVQQAIAEARDA